MKITKVRCLFAGLILLLVACQNQPAADDPLQIKPSKSVVPEVAVIHESFTTSHDESSNMDSPALWHGDNGQNWLLATAKEGNAVFVFDAATGEMINKFGTTGNGLGELNRPNGIAVTDNLAIVVERDNHRIQVFSLPEFIPLGTFGETHLRLPYGITVDWFEGKYHLYVTDNYETEQGETPPADRLGNRIHHFVFTVDNQQVNAVHIKAFGDTDGTGVLHKVESIQIDRDFNRLLIADEHEEHRNVKIYDTEGLFTGYIIPYYYFFYEPEGIVVWECEADTSGYYIIVDQGKINNTFQVFDRINLDYIGGFSGEITRNTDGIAITQKAFGNFNHGAFYPVHNDGSITAISWEEIARALNLKYACN
jgi:3-phytase